MIWGPVSFQELPIDTYPDLSPTHVEIVSQWPGHAAEEIERLVTIPIEIEMNGTPQLESLASAVGEARKKVDEAKLCKKNKYVKL